jgi:hypothetical protein
MGRDARLAEVHRVVKAMAGLSAGGPPGVNRRNDSAAVRLVHAHEASAREDASG